MKKVYFVQRFIAYLIDALIIGVISLLISQVIPTTENYKITSKEISEEYMEILQNANESDTFERLNELLKKNYVVEKEQSLINLVSVIFYVLYFGTIQYFLNGQTLGKKVAQIKIVGEDNKKVVHPKMILRSILTYTLYVNVLEAIFMHVLTESTYAFYVTPVSLIGNIYAIISFCMIAFRKDGRGLSDFICKTKVISSTN